MLNIKLEDVGFLEELSKKMVEQNKRSTSYPLFVVYDREKIVGEGSETERKEDQPEDLLCSECKKVEEEGGELPDWCINCDTECFWFFEWQDKIQENHGIFFTAEACDAYIRSRRYEFDKPYSYAISAYWSEEMKRVMDIIVNLTGDSQILK